MKFWSRNKLALIVIFTIGGGAVFAAHFLFFRKVNVPVISTIHSNWPVTAVAWSPNGEKLATVNLYGEVDLWSVDGKLVRHFGRVAGPAVSHYLGFANQGRYLITSPAALDSDRGVPQETSEETSSSTRGKDAFSVWDVEAGEVVRHVQGPPLTPGHVIYGPGSYSISPDGELVALCPPLETRVTIYSVRDWQILQIIDGPREHSNGQPRGASNFVFSPDSRRILISGDDEVVSFKINRREYQDLSPTSDRYIYPFPGSGNLVVSPDGVVMATDGAFHSESFSGFSKIYNPKPYHIRLWRFSDRALLMDYSERFATVRQASWASDGKALAVSANGAVRLYRPYDLSIPARIIIQEEAMSIGFSPQGHLLAATVGNNVIITRIEE